MAVPSTTLEAIRDVLMENKLHPSSAVEGFDSEDPGRIHKQFFFTGPRMVASEDVSGESHQHWELDIQIAYAPVGGDVDKARWDFADLVATLHQAMATNTTIKADEFGMESSDTEFNPDTGVWELRLLVSFSIYQAAV